MAIKALGALLLAVLLTVMAYMTFWFVEVTYADKQIKSAVGDVLGAEMTYGRMVWQPNATSVSMRLVSPRFVFRQGPLQSLEAEDMVVESGFLQRDNWRLRLPSVIRVAMPDGRALQLKTEGGEVVWVARDQSLSLRAQMAQVVGTGLKVSDVVLEHKPSDGGVRVNLASRPVWNGQEGQLSGKIVMPQSVFTSVLDLVARNPGLGMNDLIRTMALQLKASGGGVLGLENISVKVAGKGYGVSGQVQTDARGSVHGKVMVVADTKDVLEAWLTKAGLRGSDGRTWARVESTLASGTPALRIETQGETLLVNGFAVGAPPEVNVLVGRLWP